MLVIWIGAAIMKLPVSCGRKRSAFVGKGRLLRQWRQVLRLFKWRTADRRAESPSRTGRADGVAKKKKRRGKKKKPVEKSKANSVAGHNRFMVYDTLMVARYSFASDQVGLHRGCGLYCFIRIMFGQCAFVHIPIWSWWLVILYRKDRRALYLDTDTTQNPRCVVFNLPPATCELTLRLLLYHFIPLVAGST